MVQLKLFLVLCPTRPSHVWSAVPGHILYIYPYFKLLHWAFFSKPARLSYQLTSNHKK